VIGHTFYSKGVRNRRVGGWFLLLVAWCTAAGRSAAYRPQIAKYDFDIVIN
jgi:hypothetical protein